MPPDYDVGSGGSIGIKFMQECGYSRKMAGCLHFLWFECMNLCNHLKLWARRGSRQKMKLTRTLNLIFGEHLGPKCARRRE